MKATSDWLLIPWAPLAGCTVGWESLEVVVVGALMLGTELELVTGKQGSLREDSFWSVYPLTQTGVSAMGWIRAVI